MQRRIGQHHAQERISRRRLHRRAAVPRPSAQQDDGPPRRGEDLPLARGHLAEIGGRRRSRTMTASGFSSRRLRRATPPTAPTVPCEARQVVSPQALEGDDPPRGQGRDRDGQRVVELDRPPAAVEGLQARAARRAGDRLGVVAAVARVLVFRAAGRAHGEARHGRTLTVIRDAPDDRQTGAAMGAVEEWVAIPAVRGIEKLAQAIPAGCDVRRDEDRAGPIEIAGLDTELWVAPWRTGRPPESLDPAQRRGPGRELDEEPIQRV